MGGAFAGAVPVSGMTVFRRAACLLLAGLAGCAQVPLPAPAPLPSGACSAASAQAVQASGLTLVPVLPEDRPGQRADASVTAPRAWRLPASWGETTPANAGLVTQLLAVQDGERLWLIGSGPTPRLGAALACALAQASGRRVTDVVNTRAHPELAMGNLAFEGARLWALGDVADAMARQCPQCVERLSGRLGGSGPDVDSLAGDVIRVPGHRLGQDGATQGRLGPFDWLALPLDTGVRTLVLRHRALNLVVAQGLVWVGGVPSLRGARLAQLQPSLEALQAFSGEARVLGEQGGLGDAQAIADQRRYWQQLRLAVARQVNRGGLEPLPADLAELQAYRTLPGHAEHHGLNLQRLQRELEDTLFDRP